MRHAIANCVYALIELFLIKEVEHKILGDKRTIFFLFVCHRVMMGEMEPQHLIITKEVL